MQIRKARKSESSLLVPFILSAMEDIVYDFIGEKSYDKAKTFMEHLIAAPGNQYAYENCFVATTAASGDKIIGAAWVYDGGQLNQLRQPVAALLLHQYGKILRVNDETQAGEYYIDSVGVHPDWQGKGVGSQLFQYLQEVYVHKKGETLGLLVDIDNPNAKRLYLKLGFETIGTKQLAGKTLEHLQYRPG